MAAGPVPNSSTPAPSSRSGLVMDLGWIAGWFGLATGLAYVAVLLVRQRLLGQIVWHSRELVWMAPTAHVVLFLAAALTLTPLALVIASPRFPALAAGLFAFLGTLSLLIPFTQIARWAAGILALGVAVQAARRFTSPHDQWRGWLVRSALVMAALVTAAGVGQRAWIAIRRSREIGGLPTPDRDTPNILLLVLDTVRGQNLSLYGYPWPTTPALVRRAGESTVFDQAVASAPWTLPSHGTLFTGEVSSRLHGDFLHPVHPDGFTLAEVLRSRGYRTAGFVANLLYTSDESGLARGFTDYDDYQISRRAVMLHSPLMQTAVVQRLLASRSPTQAWQAIRKFSLGRSALPADAFRPADQIVDAFLDWQTGLEGRPFFAFLNFFDAHVPYRSPAEYQARFTNVAGTQRRYDAAIAYLDAEVDRLLSELELRGILDQTVVIVTSDHGELFGEHGLKGHSNGLYSPLVRVPLLIRYPARVAAGVRVSAAVSLRDVPATVLDLISTEAQRPELPGRSLAPSWTGAGPAPAGLVFSEVGPGINADSTDPNANTWLESVMDGRYLYIRSGKGAEELFDYTADPDESRNLAASPDRAAVVRRLRTALDSALHPESKVVVHAAAD